MQISRRDLLNLMGATGMAGALSLSRPAIGQGAGAEAALDALAAEDRFSGSVLLARNGRPVLRKAWGMADREKQVPSRPDTRFNFASMGKMFTAVGIAQLVEAGKLGWNDRLSDHLPDFPKETASRVTIAQLLSHQAGFGAYFASPRWREVQSSVRSVSDFVALFRDEPLQFEPGSRFGYSNNGYVLLGAVIERLTGEDYYAAMAKRIFRPAGMTKTGWFMPGTLPADAARSYTNGCAMRRDCTPQPWRAFPLDHGSPAGGGYSTADDWLAFANALHGGKLIKPATLAEMLKPRSDLPPGGPSATYGWGFGLIDLAGKPAFGHNGGAPGVGAELQTTVDGAVTLIMLTNQDGAVRPALAAIRQTLA